jgi:site-specific recombinase XerD
VKDQLARADYLEDHELAKLMKAARERKFCRAQRDHALLATLGNTGVRPGEALRLTVADLKLTDHHSTLRVRRLKSRKENGRIDDLPISRPLARTLARYVRAAKLGAGKLLFPMTVRNAELMFKFYAARAGLSTRYRLYCLRHTALSRAYRASKDLRLVQELAGHASIKTTQIYTHVDPRRTRHTVELAGAVI